jgi:hypothetical protein
LNLTFRSFSISIIVVFSLLSLGCASTPSAVTDDNFFKDNFVIDKNFIQLVESYADPRLTALAAERFEKNCAEAKIRAIARFKMLYPTTVEKGQVMDLRFDRDAGCTVRMAFRR